MKRTASMVVSVLALLNRDALETVVETGTAPSRNNDPPSNPWRSLLVSIVGGPRRRGCWVLVVGLIGCGVPVGAGGVDMGADGARPLTCYDGMKSGDETDVDCGGSCVPCGASQACKKGTDCDSGFCTNLVCDAPSCADSQENGAETDVDCGGGTCPKCADGKSCRGAADCLSGICTNTRCKASPTVDSAVPVDMTVVADMSQTDLSAPTTDFTTAQIVDASTCADGAQGGSCACSGTCVLSCYYGCCLEAVFDKTCCPNLNCVDPNG